MIRILLLLATFAWPVTRTHQELIDLAGRKGDITHLYDLYQRAEGVTPEEFGAIPNDTLDDGAAINLAIASLATSGGRVVFAPGKRYCVNPGANRLRVRSNVTLDLRTATIKRIGNNFSQNLIENFNYGGADSNIAIENGFIFGNSTDDTLTQSHSIPVGNIFLYGVTRFALRNLVLDSAAGDCLGWRSSNQGLVSFVKTGKFGRNAFSPTSGTDNRIENSTFIDTGFAGAIPGEYIDVENDDKDEVSSTYWLNVKAKGATFVDFHSHPDSATGNTFAHEARFENCHFTGSSPQTFRVLAMYPVRARNFVVGNTTSIAVSSSSATAFKIGRAAGVRLEARLLNTSGSAGTTRAIETADSTHGLLFRGSIDTAFANGVVATTYPLLHAEFHNAHLGAANLYVGSKRNTFNGCTFTTLTLSRADSNTFNACRFTSASVNGSGNDFQGSAILGNLVVDSSASLGNRFRADTRITGTKSFTGSATWLGQVFEREDGNLTITITGSTGGSATLSNAWGRFNLLGDVLTYTLGATITASTGTGDQRINLNLPYSIVAADTVKWAASLSASGLAYTGAHLQGYIAGGTGYILPSGLSAAGTRTAVPASTSSGTYEAVTGMIRVR